jgi:uncharacterized protein
MSNPFSATDLHFAAQAGDIHEITRLVAAGAHVNAQDDHGNTPLKYASCEPHPNGVIKLIELGASVNLADRRGFTPLHGAAAHGFWDEAVQIAEALLAAGADVNARSRELGLVPLHEATGRRMIELLLSSGADPAIRNTEGLTPLQYMIEDERLDDAEYLRRGLPSNA